MRSIKIFIVLAMIIAGINTQANAVPSMIKRIIARNLASFPQLKADISGSGVATTTTISRIVQNGFTTFQQKADMVSYNGVSDANLLPFLNYLKTIVTLPEAYSKYFVDNLSMIQYADFNEIVVYRVMFAVNTGGDCKYVCVMGERNSNGTYDFLVGNIQAQFTLAPDVLVITESKSALFGLWKSTTTKYQLVPKSLTTDQVNLLFNFFEIVTFQRFAELLSIVPSTNAFLEMLE